MGGRAWPIALCFYGLVGCVDFTYHVTHNVRSAEGAVKYSELPVAFSAALFWPLDIVAMALLQTR